MNENTHKTEKQLSVVFWARLASFGQLGLISDPLIDFQNSGMGLMITKYQKIVVSLINIVEYLPSVSLQHN